MVTTSGFVLLGASGWLGRRLAGAMPLRVLNLRDLRPTGQKDQFLSDLTSALTALRASTVVNLVGARSGCLDDLRAANSSVPALLGKSAASLGIHVIHVGSAAEYGTRIEGESISESHDCSPSSDYGETKLEGTLGLLDALPDATVFRPFNIIAARTDLESPVGDVLHQVRTATSTNQPIRLRSAATTRDFVSWQYVISSLKYAIDSPISGVYNLCSGCGNSISELARTISSLAGKDVPVSDLQETPPTAVVGNPEKWAAVSSLVESASLRRKLRISLGEQIGQG